MPTSLVPLFPGMPGGPELIVILLIVVLLFGANKLPKLARSSGQALGEFQKGREEIEEELKEMRDGATGDLDDSHADSSPANERDQGQPNQDQSNQGQRQSQQGQARQPNQGQQRQGQDQRGQGQQRQGQSNSDADEWGSPATNTERESERRRR